MDINVGDVLTLKKQHPCGSKEWEVLRIGADFRLKCKESYGIIFIRDESISLLT